jgi:TPR repeat protein
MISMGWIWQTTKLLALAVASSYVISTQAIAEDDVIEEPKRIWSVQENTVLNGHTSYNVHGNTVWGHTFGFMKHSDSCSTDRLFMKWSSYNEGIADIEGQDINITFATPIETFDMDIPLVAVIKPEMFTGKIAVFSDIRVTKLFFESLGKEGELEITINAPNKNPAYFDIPTDNFHLDNLRESQLEAAIQCLNAHEDPEGQYTLGLMLDKGEGVFRDRRLGRIWISKSASNGFADGLAALGLLAESEKETEAASIYFLSAAKQGHTFAQYKIGYYQYYGKAVKKDRAKAFNNFLMSATNGNSESLGFLADMYHNGDGVEQDDKKALYWARKSAATGDKKGEYLLGLLLYRGSAGVLDRSLAEEWFLKAVDQGYGHAILAMGQVEHDKKNYSAALSWFKKSADQHNHRKAQWMVGKYYTDAKYVQNDVKQGIKYLEQAANQNLSDAILDLALLYAKGTVVEKDVSLAAKWVKKSASIGNAKSQLHTADLLSNGKVIDGENFVEALSWALVSKENGNGEAFKAIDKLENLMFRPLITLAKELSAKCLKSHYKNCQVGL